MNSRRFMLDMGISPLSYGASPPGTKLQTMTLGLPRGQAAAARAASPWARPESF
jgi:hypothetical protein